MESDNQEYYGAPSNSEVKPLRERLRDYYDEADMVTILNVDDKPIKYQFSAPNSIETYSAYPGHKETTMNKPPQVITLQPGESKVCPAYEADLMIENLIKQITTSKVAGQIKDGKLSPEKIANWADPETQEAIIKEAFRGKQDLMGEYNKTLNQPVVQTNQVADDLGIEDEPAERTARVGRPPKAAV